MKYQRRLTRREFLKLCGLGTSSLFLGAALDGCARPATQTPYKTAQPAETLGVTTETEAAAAEAIPATSALEALRDLIEGNRRFAGGGSKYPRRDPVRRVTLVNGQQPIAAILTCSDSRVPPEILFDQGLGDIFILRTAGNVAGPVGLGSLEYAVEHLAVPLVVVLGHQQCGAVSAAVQGSAVGGHVYNVVQMIAPAVETVRHNSGDLLSSSIDANVLLGVERLKSSAPVLSKYNSEGKVEIVGARYDLDTGLVQWLAGSPSLNELLAAQDGAAPEMSQSTLASPSPQTSQPAQPTSVAAIPTQLASGSGSTAGSERNGRILGVHVVRRGESLYLIGRAYGVDPYAIAAENNLANPNLIYSGMRLRIPKTPWKNMPGSGPAAAPQF